MSATYKKILLGAFLIAVIALIIFLLMGRYSGGNPLQTELPERTVTATPTPTPSVPGMPTRTPTSTPTSTPAAPTTVTIKIVDNAFVPDTIHVTRGAAVRFTNNGGMAHTATAEGGEFDSQVINPGQSYTLNTASLARGDYRYLCNLHNGMTGTLIID